MVLRKLLESTDSYSSQAKNTKRQSNKEYKYLGKNEKTEGCKEVWVTLDDDYLWPRIPGIASLRLLPWCIIR